MSFQEKVNKKYVDTLYKNYGKYIGYVTNKNEKEHEKAIDKNKVNNKEYENENSI